MLRGWGDALVGERIHCGNMKIWVESPVTPWQVVHLWLHVPVHLVLGCVCGTLGVLCSANLAQMRGFRLSERFLFRANKVRSDGEVYIILNVLLQAPLTYLHICVDTTHTHTAEQANKQHTHTYKRCWRWPRWVKSFTRLICSNQHAVSSRFVRL